MHIIKTYSQFNEGLKDWLLAGALSAASLKSNADVIKPGQQITKSTEDTKPIVFPVFVTGEYTAKDCDALHAFQSRKKMVNGKNVTELIGNMHVLVSDTLLKLHKSGYNVKPTKVSVKVEDMKVKWKVQIEESTDGYSWVGFTSRGAGCSTDIMRRSKTGGNSIDSVKERVINVMKEPDTELQVVNDFVYNHDNNGFRQVFFCYTRPDSFPANPVTTHKIPQIVTNEPKAIQNKNISKNNSDVTVFSKELDFKPGVLNQIYNFYSAKFEIGINYKLDNFSITYDKENNKVSADMRVIEDKNSEWFNFVFVSGVKSDKSSLNRVVSANKEYRPEVVRKGQITLPDGIYDWYLVGLRKP
jgi:hypothetical protein